MKLLLDFGNTRLKYAVYEGSAKKTAGYIPELSAEMVGKIPYFEEVKSIIISTVIEIPATILELIAPKLIPNNLVLQGKEYDVSTLGEDRILLAKGAAPSHLIICLGTCITYNLVDESNAFIGGAISPGLHMRAAAMHGYTAHLPMVEPQTTHANFGNNTQTNLIAGIMAGVEFEIKGFVQEAQKRVPNVQVVLTGGDAQYYEYLYPVDPDLMWKGMLSAGYSPA